MPDYTDYTHEQLVQEVNKKETSRKKLKASLVWTRAKYQCVSLLRWYTGHYLCVAAVGDS